MVFWRGSNRYADMLPEPSKRAAPGRLWFRWPAPVTEVAESDTAQSLRPVLQGGNICALLNRTLASQEYVAYELQFLDLQSFTIQAGGIQ